MGFATNNPRDFSLFGIPVPASVVFTYVGSGMSSNDLVATATYKDADGTIIGVLAYAYVGATNNVASVTRTA